LVVFAIGFFAVPQAFADHDEVTIENAVGSSTPGCEETVRAVFDGFIMVGGGIRSAKTASSLIKAGADGLVIGTLLEQTGGLKKFTDMLKSI
jgi:phosphoglycerol geranylgeranyltransferase